MDPERDDAPHDAGSRRRSPRREGQAEEYVFLIVAAEPVGGEPPIGELW